ncbi:hypothetical protein QT397_14805 [Microbulbifer sp. MKSA007]|nr:hypothetical protein QT397_14805 [Microbulbifer sp. MKSA007]
MIKNMQPIRRELQAGIPVTVEVGGEFVFIDQGDDIEIRIDGMIMPRRRAGDVMRGSSAFSRVTLTSDTDQTVDIVVGFGEYNRLIVSGEMNISAYVTTGRGVSSVLPMAITKTVGLESTDQWFAAGGSYFKHSIDDANTECTQTGGIFYWDGSFYAIFPEGLARYEVGDYLVEPTSAQTQPTEFIAWAGGEEIPHTTFSEHSENSRCTGATITKSGEIYFHMNGALWWSHIETLELFNMSGENLTNPVQVHDGVTDSDNYCTIGLSGNSYYWIQLIYDENDNTDGYFYLVGVDIDSRHVTTTKLGNGVFTINSGATFNYGFVEDSGALIVYVDQGAEREGLYEFDTSGTLIGEWFNHTFMGNEINYPFGATEVYGAALSPDKKLVCYGESGEVVVGLSKSTSVYATLYIQDGSDTATRVYHTIDDWRSIFSRNGGKIIYGGVIQAMLSVVNEGVTDNYLDYITSVEFYDGRLTRKYDTGTQSFAQRGVTDGFPYFLESSVTIEILPEFFDQ